jgi:membrane protein DedA with SNARE-associated domain/rhodanese-related sulfurtransferase
MHPGASIATALSALLLGDLSMYVLGRYTGWWLLGIMCRLSISPESCILRSADAFYKRGRAVLVIAKFVPGITALAAPLAGSMRMPVAQFLALDLAGASLYTLVYWGVGYLCSDFLGAITRGYTQFSGYVEWSVAILFAGYLGYRVLIVLRDKKRGPVVKVSALDVSRRLAGTGVRIAVFDVRSHGYYEKDSMRIQGSARLEPNALNQQAVEVPKDKEIVLYCTCVREATSVRVARILADKGYTVSVIAGGLRAWKKAGLPLERVPKDDIVHLPTFS